MSVGNFKIYNPAPAARRHEFTFGCCITAFNNRETIRDAVFSALDQTLPFDRIVVVDDASTDGTQAVLAELEGRYSSLSIVYKKHNGGVSAARNAGLQKLGTSYLTQLDGDDCFWPTKNRAEAEVVFDDPEAVAFSLTLVDRGQHGSSISSYPGYSADSATVFDNLLSRVDPIPRDLTFSAHTFRKTGGYDLRLSLYEDWDLKLRLAQTSQKWRVSDSHAGTVYNRRNSGLSGGSDLEHAHSLAYVFAKAAIATPDVKGLARRFAEAVASRRQHVPRALYALIARIDAGELDVSALEPLTSRAWIAMQSNIFGSQPEELRANEVQRDDLEWRPLSGFSHETVQFPSIDRPRLCWISEQRSVVGLKVKRTIWRLQIELFNPVAACRIEVEARNGSATVFTYSSEVPLGQSRGRWLQPKLLSISHILQPGEYELNFRIQPLHEDVSRLWQAEGNRMHMALSDVRAAPEGTLG